MGTPGQKQISRSARKAALNAVKSRPEKSQKLKNTDRKNRNSGEASTTAQTCCSNCQTVFEVSLDLLSTSDTRVRCGECLSIFDALANLRDITQDGDNRLSQAQSEDNQSDSITLSDKLKPTADQPSSDTPNLPNANAALLAGLDNDKVSLDVTYSDFDLFSSDAGLPDTQYLDQTRGIQDFHFDDVSDIDDETFSDTLFAQDATVDARSVLHHAAPGRNSSSITLGGDVGFITDESHREPLIFNYRDTELEATRENSLQALEAGHSSDAFDGELPFDEPDVPIGSSTNGNLRVPESVSSPWLLRVGLFLIVLITVGSLYAYRDQDALFNNSFLRPWLSNACELLSCQLPDQTNLNALRAVDRSVVKHPTVANALIIKFGIVNQASFSQPHPVLEIRLTDRAGRLVVINQFSPSEYLRGWQQGDVLDTGKRLDIGLAVEDPGNTAISFELDFHEVK